MQEEEEESGTGAKAASGAGGKFAASSGWSIPGNTFQAGKEF